MAGIIAQDLENLNQEKRRQQVPTYIIITPVPSETKTQYLDEFRKYQEFNNVYYEDVTGRSLSSIQKVIKSKNNYKAIILICSKQFLEKSKDDDDDCYDIQHNEEETNSTTKKGLLTNTKLHKHITFFDEVHFGGTTT